MIVYNNNRNKNKTNNYSHFVFFIFLIITTACTRDYSNDEYNLPDKDLIIKKEGVNVLSKNADNKISLLDSNKSSEDKDIKPAIFNFDSEASISKKITFKEYSEKGNKTLPEYSKWETNMINFGKKHCASIKDKSRGFDPRLADTYYDAEWIYYRIYDYTGDTSWLSCADAAEKVYRDEYVIANNGGIQGFWLFTHGLLEDYLRTKDVTSKNALLLIAKNAAFARVDTPLSDTVSTKLSREVAYNIMGYINSEKAGNPLSVRYKNLVSQAFGHMNEWFVEKNAPFIKSFMVSLTSQALIAYYDKSKDPKAVSTIKIAMDSLWKDLWVKDKQAFRYMNKEGEPDETMDPAPDLDLLIAPVYAWIYHITGEKKYSEIADQIFAGGVRGAWLENGKQFNQSYRWSFDYVKWRLDSPLSEVH